jgi:translocator protein
MAVSIYRQMSGLIGWLLVSFAAAAIAGFASASAPEFYQEIIRPSWAPPGWLFGPVWTVLYILMGTAAWLVWRVRGFTGASGTLILFIVQLAFNALWTWLFFVWRQGGLAFAEILLLSVLIAITVRLFWQVSKLAGVMLVPYLVWVCFASALTLATWRLNPEFLG